MHDLPWQKAQWDLLQNQFAMGRNPHAILLCGPADLGKREFAERLGCWLLCKDESATDACGQCNACILLQAGTHADLRRVSPEDSKLIRIDHIRELNDWAVQTGQHGDRKVAIVYPAEQMNVQAENALLKGLEEPVSETLFILISDQPARLLPTTRSRCQSYQFAVPTESVALKWLEKNAQDTRNLAQALALARGSPIKVIREIDSKYLERRELVSKMLDGLIRENETALAGALQLQKHDAIEVLEMLQSFTTDAITAELGGDESRFTNLDYRPVVLNLGAKIGLDGLFGLNDLILESIRHLNSNSNPNSQLLVESILVNISRRVPNL